MSKQIDGGVQAFPRSGGDTYDPVDGMTLRDYFAARAPMPDAADVCISMGWERDLKIGDEGSIGAEAWDDSLTARWHELPRSKRFLVECQHRYAWADAMLLARDHK